MTDRIYTDDDGKPKPGVRERVALMTACIVGTTLVTKNAEGNPLSHIATAGDAFVWAENIELESRRRAAAEREGGQS